ncbi:O-antigen ligase family protein [Draconibacterium sp. IB214405]|uniref:O-antigen ligase family protein n=1 Tax=Draconibacterium sp. IB214405 TaxID=3097352 RepID=UPI002A14CCFB|nr:O-antigen ligase family protein [Draconibacterium sp. IB214405]MDX8341726.1 O-antigen ligase family protein [Draconibacterium sp. IB214405]
MPQKAVIRIALFYLISIGFIALNLWFVVEKHMQYANVLPLAFAVVLLAVFSFEKVIYLIAFLAPLSIPLREYLPGIGFDMYIPTEPLLFGLLLLFILKVIQERQFERKILLHPVSLAVYLNLFWILITSVTSTMPMVSFKFLLMRIWFVVGLYLLTAKIFKDGKNMEKYVWLYVIPLIVVIFYSTYRHLGYGLWDKQAAHFVVSPFYRDHTSYGAATAIYIPFLVMFILSKSYSKNIRILSSIAFAIVTMGLLLSYSRAAWLSLVIAFGVWSVVKLRIRFKPLFITVVSVIVLFLAFQSQILMKLEQNSEESSANMMTHISSMSNISSDASNLERINRWSCAIRMFADKPVVGYGPGTYMFKYAKYQLSKDRTIISTNSADGGNAHSEYLGPMAESGVLGLATYLLIIIVVIYTAVNTYTRLTDYRLRSIVLAALVGLVTYYIHGLLNNFLDTDKISVPFWGFTAMIVAIDILSRKHDKETAQKQVTE